MRIFIASIMVIMALLCCKSPSQPRVDEQKTVPAEKQSFFPVTSYIKGQLYEIRERGVNPLKYTIINDHTDSAWVKIEDLNEAVREFLYPEIDSLNLINIFTEKKFLDRSIEAYTFTYDPISTLPDTMMLRHWDVYIDPASNKVRRIYMVKQISDTKMLQLTWQSNKWCKIVTITTGKDRVSVVEKEEKITWDF